MGHSRLHDVIAEVDRTAAVTLPVVVFDLDSTLFDTAARNHRILQEFAELTGGPLEAIFQTLTLADFGWDVRGPLRARGYDDAATLEALGRFWAQRFFTDRYVALDHPSPGAVEFVHRCHDAGALVYYLTGRHVGGMERGTVEALTRNGFPLFGGRAQVHLKPDFHTADVVFKDQALTAIRSLRGRVVATFDNEPGNCNLFARSFPGGLHFWMRTVHSPDAEPPGEELIETRDFLLP